MSEEQAVKLIARADQIDNRPGPIPDGSADAIATELRAAATGLRDLGAALEESVKLQSHYADLLNAYDGGRRLYFPNAAAWLERLATLKSTSRTPPAPP